MPQYYNYATTTLQKDQIEQLEQINTNLQDLNMTMSIIAFVLVTTLITSFVRNIF